MVKNIYYTLGLAPFGLPQSRNSKRYIPHNNGGAA